MARIRPDLVKGVDFSDLETNIVSLDDGITVPSTVAGRGQIYIDTADGDLKIKFSDGFVSIIATDTAAGQQSTSGHTIQDSGVNLSVRANLNFDSPLVATDDAGNDQSDITLDQAALDHGSIGGLADDDHTQYLNETRHDALAADNPHSVTITQSVTADAGTNVTVTELETLTDGSNADALHVHLSSGIGNVDGGTSTSIFPPIGASPLDGGDSTSF